MTTPLPVEDFDPAELQDGLLMNVGDVHERLRRAREKHPVMLGNPFVETASPTLGMSDVTVLGYDECAEALSDSGRFSTSIYQAVMGVVMGRTLLEMDGDEHRAHKALVSPAFRQKLLARWQSELVEVVVDELIDRFAERGSAELVREFTFAFPVQVIARILGLPRQEYPRFQRLSIELLNVVYDWDRGMAASAALKEYFGAVLDDRRRKPQDDLISSLAEAEIDGQRLSDDEIFAFLRILLPAGVETTYRSSGNLLVGLLTHPDSLEELRGNRALLPVAIEEALRWEPPITSLVRVAVNDTELAGVPIKAGAAVNISVASGNRDPQKFERPEAFDLHRSGIAHLTFGHGPHLCLGMHLARMETKVAMNALLDRLPDLRLDDSAPPPVIQGVAFRSPAALPVRFTPAAR